MASIPELAEPDVRVTQTYTTDVPTIVVPSLAAMIVGACYEIYELNTASGQLNSDILVDGPAVATAPKDQSLYTAMALKTLTLRVNGGPLQSFTMPNTAALTAAQVAAAINTATVAPSGFYAYTWTNPATAKIYLQLRTTGTGADKTIQIVGGTLLDAPDQLGYGKGYTYYGVGSYIQDKILLKQSSFPDPKSLGTQRDIIESSIRAFMNLTSYNLEALRTQSFLRRGSTITVVNDGDGDLLTPLLDLNENLLATPGAATHTGTTDVSTGKALHGKTLVLQVDGSGKQTVTLCGDPVISTDSTGPAWTFPHTSNITISVNGSSQICAVAGAADIAAIISQLNVASQAWWSVNIAFRSDASGNVAPAGNYIGLVYGADPTAAAAANPNNAIRVTLDSLNEAFLNAHVTAYTQLLATGGAGPRVAIETQINNVLGASIASITGANLVKLTSTTSGYESKIELHTESTGLVASPNGLGMTAGAYYGTAFNVRQGDALYADNALLGYVIETHPGAVSGYVKLDREVATTATYTTWYIIAKNLDAVSSTQWGVTVPTPDLMVDTNGDVWIKHDILRDSLGQPIVTVAVNLYLMFNALRTDVTSQATNPTTYGFDSYDALEAALPPVSPENPLAYGLYIAMLNAPDTRIYGLGVHEVSADKPDGTITGFASALDFLESKEVYGIAPMCSDLDVATIMQTHVDAMSDPDMGGERICAFHLAVPTRKVDEIVVSGNDGDTVPTTTTFDTKIPTLTAALQALGIDPTAIAVSDGVFLDVAYDAYRWNITGAILGGTIVQTNIVFAAGENDDSFYATGTFPAALVSESFSVKVRGATISDKDDEVTTVYNRGTSFFDRRMWMLYLNQLYATVDGVEQAVDGFYACAAKVGQVAGLDPDTPLTKRTMAGFTRVTGTSDRYTRRQMNQMAAGGADIIIQAGEDTGPVYSRHQVTTDSTSWKTREQSVVKVVDFCAKFYRAGLRRYIGRNNITQAFLDGLSMISEGLSLWLTDEKKAVNTARINSLEQSATDPTRARGTCYLGVKSPLNGIDLELVI